MFMDQPRTKPNSARWAERAAFACFASSVLSLALGFVFTTNSLLDEILHPLVHAVGITLLIIGIPILILGGHCLDLMEKSNKKADQLSRSARSALPEQSTEKVAENALAESRRVK